MFLNVLWLLLISSSADNLPDSLDSTDDSATFNPEKKQQIIKIRTTIPDPEVILDPQAAGSRIRITSISNRTRAPSQRRVAIQDEILNLLQTILGSLKSDRGSNDHSAKAHSPHAINENKLDEDLDVTLGSLIRQEIAASINEPIDIDLNDEELRALAQDVERLVSEGDETLLSLWTRSMNRFLAPLRDLIPSIRDEIRESDQNALAADKQNSLHYADRNAIQDQTCTTSNCPQCSAASPSSSHNHTVHPFVQNLASAFPLLSRFFRPWAQLWRKTHHGDNNFDFLNSIFNHGLMHSAQRSREEDVEAFWNFLSPFLFLDADEEDQDLIKEILTDLTKVPAVRLSSNTVDAFSKSLKSQIPFILEQFPMADLLARLLLPSDLRESLQNPDYL